MGETLVHSGRRTSLNITQKKGGVKIISSYDPESFEEFLKLPVNRTFTKRNRVQTPVRGAILSKMIYAEKAKREEAKSKRKSIVDALGLRAKLDYFKNKRQSMGIGLTLDKTKICNWGLIELAQGLFQPDFLVANFKGIREGRQTRSTIRSLWEFSSPTDQCNNVIKPAGQGKDNQNCWLCGGAFDFATKNPNLQPSCDHVLPIAQASMFLELFKNPRVMKRFLSKPLIKPPTEVPVLTDSEVDKKVEAFKDKLTNGTPPGLMTLEYAWSHRGCNVSKTDIVFIKLNSADKARNIVTWEVDERNIKIALDKILSDGRTLGIEIKSPGNDIATGKITKEKWIQYRFGKMKEFKINAIVAELNKSKGEFLDVLHGRSTERCIDSADPRALQYLRTSVRQVTKAILGANLEQFGNNSLLAAHIDTDGGQSTDGETQNSGRGRKRNRKTRRVRKN